ncbi:unnamed protein product [Oppiella nova]|uniref:Ras-GEF domain-containing protein n=1 Tax=Oppiella nova TaxID=334625 RepID=A0A7R9QQX2_9ACAR|nr:unnamed protein product [Oppiella nova]CAG2172322.1 unnamed protein product [Oppiella nova]
MESLSVTNLQVFDLEDSYVSPKNGKTLRYIKSPDDNNNHKKHRFNLKLNFGNFYAKNKYSIARNDSGYISGNTSAETVFSIDNNNYISFRHNPAVVSPEQRRHHYQSSQSLYDRSPVDLSDVFGLSLKCLTPASGTPVRRKESHNCSNNHNNNNNYLDKNRNFLSLPSQTELKLSKEYSVQNLSQISRNGWAATPTPIIHDKYENRTWDGIHELADRALSVWVRAPTGARDRRRCSRKFAYFEPNLDTKYSLMLNQNLLCQPIRRHTSELNLRKLVVDSGDLFADDQQLQHQYLPDIQDIQTGADMFANNSIERQLERDVKNRVAEDMYKLFVDLHEFRINDVDIDRVSDNICKIDRYLMSRIRARDLANYLFSNTCCGCRLSSLCSVVQFSQALADIIVECIDGKIAAYQRQAYIIAFIKLSMSLYQKSNWQSLSTLMAALQSPKIYRMSIEWQQIRQNQKHYYDEYIKLAAIVRSGETSLMYTLPKGIPALKNLLLTQKLNCMSRWDRIEWPAKWTQHPGIITWLERELKHSIKTTLINKYQTIEDMDVGGDKQPKQLICLIPMSKMPDNWLSRSLKNIPLEYRPQILEFLVQRCKDS